MDRAAIKRVLTVLALALLSGALSNDLPLRAARWTIPARQTETLTTEPAECASVAGDAEQARRIAIGRVAFRAPLLLGGRAARAGLSCNACHRGGRSNPGFFFPGLSSAPGTADVTSSIMSSHRGDGAFNPRPIPDLSAAKDRLAIDQDPSSKRLERFIRGLIVEEFDGPEPTPATVAGLATFVRALSPAVCSSAVVPLDLAHDLRRIDDALALVGAVDPATAQMLVASARATMGLIEERYPGPRSHAAMARLRAASIALGAIERRFATEPATAMVALADWRRDAERWRAPLRRAEAKSLYDPRQLSKRLRLTLAVTRPTD